MSSLSSRNGLKNLKIIRMFLVDKKGGYWAISPTFLHHILTQINF